MNCGNGFKITTGERPSASISTSAVPSSQLVWIFVSPGVLFWISYSNTVTKMKSDAIFAKISESLKEIDHSNRSFTPTIQYNIRNSSGLIEKKMGKQFLVRLRATYKLNCHCLLFSRWFGQIGNLWRCSCCWCDCGNRWWRHGEYWC